MSGSREVGRVSDVTGPTDVAGPGAVRRRRGSRRVDAPGTGPVSADGPEPPRELTPGAHDVAADDAQGRWLLEQRPPHWG
ncbi:MAG: hypothetical protein Q4G34_07095 [Micrococcus sp.]|nr:hypothetical protein [Micrococcus sp.]